MTTPSGRYGVRMGRTCAVHVHHEHVPMERHHVWPLGDGGPDVEANKITVCANGHYSIHAYLDLLVRHGGEVPWDTGKYYGPHVRSYALKGYDAIRSATS